MRRNRRAKIVATVGPASASPDMLEALFLAGVDTFRLNFSHGTHADHANVHAAIRALEQKVGRPDRHPAGSAGTENPRRDHQGRQDQRRGRRSGALRAVRSGRRQDVDPAAASRNLRCGVAWRRSPDRRWPGPRPRDRRRRRLHRCEGRHRRRDLQPQGRQCPERGSESVAADRKGPRRSRLRAGAGSRLGSAVIRAKARRRHRSARADRRPRRDHGQDRKACRTRTDRRHRPPLRCRDGRARRSRRRNSARGRARPSEGA